MRTACVVSVRARFLTTPGTIRHHSDRTRHARSPRPPREDRLRSLYSRPRARLKATTVRTSLRPSRARDRSFRAHSVVNAFGPRDFRGISGGTRKSVMRNRRRRACGSFPSIGIHLPRSPKLELPVPWLLTLVRQYETNKMQLKDGWMDRETTGK